MKIGPDCEDSGTQLDRVQLNPSAGLRFRVEPLPKGKNLVHYRLVKRAAVKTGKRWIDSERIFEKNAALLLPSGIEGDESIEAGPDRGHLGGGQSEADRCSDIAHIPLNKRHLDVIRRISSEDK